MGSSERAAFMKGGGQAGRRAARHLGLDGLALDRPSREAGDVRKLVPTSTCYIGRMNPRWLLLFGALVLGCGDDDVPPIDGGAGDAARDASGSFQDLADVWCPELASRYCEAALGTCGCAAVPEFGDAATCRARVERACRGQLDGFEGQPIEAASSVPESCAPALAEALDDCRMPEPDLFAVRCPLVWPAGLDRSLPSSGACVEGLCAEGARCSSGATCAMPTSGGACGNVGDCPDGEVCGDEGTCRALALDGAGASCSGPEACTGDLRCLAATRRACEPLAPGAICTSDDGCVAGEYCAEGTCVAAPGEGAPCGNGVACAEGLACAFAPGPDEGTCQPFPTSGEPCALGTFGPFVCAEGLACRDRLCGPIPNEGDDCAVGDVRCAEGLGCAVEGERSVCRARVGDGEPCMLDDTCEAGTFCDFSENRCRAYFATGDVCRAGNECGPSGACVPDETATTFRCTARPGVGEACFLDDSCEAGLVCRSPFDAGACAPPLCAAFVF